MGTAIESNDLLEKLAADITVWFPELNGRAIPVSDARVTKQNIPTLPLVMVALVSELTDAGRTGAVNLSQRSQFELVDTFTVEYWLKTNRVVDNESETPFWSYYDYAAIRNRLLSCMYQYLGPNGERIWYVGMVQEVTEYAVMLVFTFQAKYNWCPDDQVVNACSARFEKDGQLITDSTFSTKLCAPRSTCCIDPNCEEKEEEDPCDTSP